MTAVDSMTAQSGGPSCIVNRTRNDFFLAPDASGYNFPGVPFLSLYVIRHSGFRQSVDEHLAEAEEVAAAIL